MIAYLRLFPKTLIAGWSSGTGLSGIISGGLNLLTQLIEGLSLKYLYLILTPVGPIYLFLFLWTFKLLNKNKNTLMDEIDSDNIETIGDEKKGTETENETEAAVETETNEIAQDLAEATGRSISTSETQNSKPKSDSSAK